MEITLKRPSSTLGQRRMATALRWSYYAATIPGRWRSTAGRTQDWRVPRTIKWSARLWVRIQDGRRSFFWPFFTSNLAIMMSFHVPIQSWLDFNHCNVADYNWLVTCVEFSLQKYRLRANILKKNNRPMWQNLFLLSVRGEAQEGKVCTQRDRHSHSGLSLFISHFHSVLLCQKCVDKELIDQWHC
jgi:hypothetical protein